MSTRRFFLVLSVALFISTSIHAQYGKIRGIITDADTGEPIIGATVLIQGTTKGAATNVDGEYIIVAVNPGVYNLRVSYIGYSTTVIEDVKVSIDLSTQIDVKLKTQTLQGEEIVVIAQRDLIKKDVTASLATVDAKQIEAIPVENFSEVVELQAGVVDGHFRGGRRGEVGYWVDGVPVTDAFDGSLSAGVENSSVQEVQVVTGAFNAEYGQAMSGIVNIVTKNGNNDFEGSVHSFVGDYVSSRDNLFRNIDNVSPVAVRNLEGSLSGPVLKDKLFFFSSVRYFQNEGWLYGREVFDFNDVGINSLGQLALLDTTGTGSGDIVSMNSFEKINGQLKLTWKGIKGVTLSANAIYGVEDFQDYNHSAQFLPQFLRGQRTNNRSFYVKGTHLLSNSTFYDISISNSYKKFESHLFEDPFDERYVINEYANFRASNVTSNFLIGGTDNGRTERETSTYIAKFDLSSQVNNENQIKIGIEARQHNLKFLDQVSIVTQPGGPVDGIFTNAQYDVNPFEISAYVQDKVEIGSIIINAGIRFDYFDSNFKVFRDPTDPNVVFEGQRPRDSGGNIVENLVFKKSTPTSQFSPRLGIAFPISEKGVVHFSYGHFFQTPNLQLLYQNPFFRLSSGGSGLIGLLGNANLKPQKTINGELGYKQELSSSSAIEITAFFRDIRNLAGTATDPIAVQGTSARYGIITNSDFGFIKGVVLAFDQSFGPNIFATADYTFQIAKGNSSDPDQAFNAAAAKTELEQIIVPLNWDQTHTLNITGSYRSKNGWGAGFIFNAGSGFPYTRDFSNPILDKTPPSKIPLNSARRPTVYNLDINITKDITFSDNTNVQVYAKLDNVLDTGNERGVFNDTGRATYSLFRNVDAKTFIGDEVFLNQNYTRPDFYNEPRRLVLGMRIRF